MLTCPCGARFEVDDTLAGQEVLCPECQQLLKAPALDRPPRVTSGWALASIVLALVGAFTIVGTIAAALLGLFALIHIARHRQRVAGAGLAVTGLCLGILFTGLTVFALSSGDLFGLDGVVRERTLAQPIDTSGPLEVVRALQGFAITRPTEKWGQVPGNQSGDPAVSGLQRNRDLLLMQVPRHAFIDVRRLPAAPLKNLDQCESDVLAEFDTHPQRPQNPLDEDDDDDFAPVAQPRLQSSRQLSNKDGVEVREMIVEVRCANRPWQFLIRLHRRNNGAVYVVRAYTPRRQAARIKNELETALDSFRLLPR